MSSRIVIPVVVLLFVGMLVLMAPTLVSQFGVAALVTKVNQGVPGSVSIAELSLSWFGRIRGRTVKSGIIRIEDFLHSIFHLVDCLYPSL